MKTLKIEELGTENIVTVFLIILKILTAIRNLVKEFNVGKLVQLGFDVIQYGNIIAVARHALVEFRNLNPEKAKDIRDQVKAQFDIPDDQLEADIEEGIGLAEETYELAYDGTVIIKKWRSFFQRITAKKEEAKAAA